MSSTLSIPTEILARIIELSSPRSLAAAPLVSRQWNRASRILLPTLGLKARLKLHVLQPERRSNDQTSQRADAPPSWLVGVQNIRLLPEFERGTVDRSTASPARAVLVAMTADVTINCPEFAALRLLDRIEAARTLSDGIRTAIRPAVRLPTDDLNISLSVAMLHVTEDNGTALLHEALPENSAALDKALNLCRLLRVPHIQLDRISYLLWFSSTPPLRGAPLPSVTEVSLVDTDNEWVEEARWAYDSEIHSVMAAFASEKFPFPNAKRLATPHGELQVTPSNNLRFLRLSRSTVLHMLTPSALQRTTAFVSDLTNDPRFFVNSLPPSLKEFGAISLVLGMWAIPDHPYLTVLSSLPATVHTVHATIHFSYLFYAASLPLLDLFTQFSTLLPAPTRRLILTITGADPPRVDILATARKLWRALVEIAKRVIVDVRIDQRPGSDYWVKEVGLYASWKEELDELVAVKVLKAGTVILCRPKRANGLYSAAF
ncbi:hypothetical protein M427DRAFT_60664 [Gonapodya prolifera JEL478]|uniref:F-box domain-containing protein n=1 Tax=Gonapodya prolifera (strain JEL478) TaxID=1344416 RepID=A0A139A4L0_GONPJ|nr:hypothetical protein M427DRAFT_60664 [Gonapodya prolifera JEL478]|eukprot:KXS11415.1 hypothetical protein M427DRAFT_60664 [Gonapodya prolifera JEL478]